MLQSQKDHITMNRIYYIHPFIYPTEVRPNHFPPAMPSRSVVDIPVITLFFGLINLESHLFGHQPNFAFNAEGLEMLLIDWKIKSLCETVNTADSSSQRGEGNTSVA